MGTKIADLELSARLLVIEKGAFGSCTALRTLIFPQSLRMSIGASAFAGWTAGTNFHTL